jgi:hypothetical protein
MDSTAVTHSTVGSSMAALAQILALEQPRRPEVPAALATTRVQILERQVFCSTSDNNQIFAFAPTHRTIFVYQKVRWVLEETDHPVSMTLPEEEVVADIMEVVVVVVLEMAAVSLAAAVVADRRALPVSHRPPLRLAQTLVMVTLR